MQTTDFVDIVRGRLRETGQSLHGAAVSHGLPRDAMRRVLDGRIPGLDRAIDIASALGLEFYIGPPRKEIGHQVSEHPAYESTSPLASGFEDHTQGLVRAVHEAGGDPIPDDLRDALLVSDAADKDTPPSARPVDVIELACAAGGGADVLSEEVAGQVWFRRDWLDSQGLDATQCTVIGVSGESMEPTLVEGAKILVNRLRRDWRKDNIYVVRTGDGLVVKRAGEDEDGRRLLVSDHPAWKDVLLPNDAEVIGEVVWTARTLVR